jgi:hypothetical protein
MGKMAQICNIRIFFFKLLDFYDKFKKVTNNIKDSVFFSTFISNMYPNMAKPFHGQSPLQLHHNFFEKNLVPIR